MPFYWWNVDSLVASMIDFLGELRTEWQPKGKQLRLNTGRCSKLGENGQLSGQRLEQMFDKIIQEPKSKVLRVIKRLMRFLPSDRISASQALEMIEMMTASLSSRLLFHCATAERYVHIVYQSLHMIAMCQSVIFPNLFNSQVISVFKAKMTKSLRLESIKIRMLVSNQLLLAKP